MENEKQQLEALKDIRKMMQESSKFLSLSGLSGIFAGIYALIGAWLGYSVIISFNSGYPRNENFQNEYSNHLIYLFLICCGVLFMSIITAFFFSNNKAKKNNQKLFDHSSKKLLWNMMIPLVTGGSFCLALLYHGHNYLLLIAPSMLIFYGIALINSSKFTLHDIKYLGYLEVILGIVSCFSLKNGLVFWALGFGVLHIVYGTIMWFKYDRSK